MPRYEEDLGIYLRLSAQRALWGNVPASLRAVSVELRGTTIFFRAVFAPDATEEEKEMLSDAAGEVIADFEAQFLIQEEYLDLAPPMRPTHLEHLVFLRAEAEDLNSAALS